LDLNEQKKSVIVLYESFNTARDVLAKDGPLDSSQIESSSTNTTTTSPTPTPTPTPTTPAAGKEQANSFFQQTEKITQKLSKLAKKLDPEKVTQSLADLSTGVVAVIGSLQSSLARCITIGSSISDLVLMQHKDTFSKFAKEYLPMEFHKWIEPGFYYGSKLLGFWIAFFIQKWLLVYSTCLRGADLLLSGLHERKIISDEQFVILCKISVAVAAVGFLKQLFYGADMWAIFQVILCPLFLLELILKYIAVFVK